MQVFRQALFCALFSACCAGSAAQEPAWGEPYQGISIGLVFSNATMIAGEPVLATVVMRNQSKVETRIAVRPNELFFDFTAMDEQGKPIPRKEKPLVNAGVATLPFRPGESRSFVLDLRDYVEVTRPGRLTVTAQRNHFGTILTSKSRVIELVAKK